MAPRAVVDDGTGKLLSIIVPLYNVEQYVAECLDSLLAQTYPWIEVVVVDDGSPDGSFEIARQYAEHHPTAFTLVRQANAGLSAARNAGVRAARGDFLMFVDSDDTLPDYAADLLVSTLLVSGSDFSVGPYRRMDSRRQWPAAPWIRAAHTHALTSTTIEEHPAVLANVIACSKVYRRAWWDVNGFEFPDGVLYEDQTMAARIYASARAFDVVSRVIYNWRFREDRSSISQQMADPGHLRARLAAAKETWQILNELAGEDIARARLVQLLVNDFPQYVSNVPLADDSFFDVLADGLRELTEWATDDVWEAMPAGTRVLTQLMAGHHRDELVDFLSRKGRDVKQFPTEVVDGRVLAHLPLRDHPGLARESFHLSRAQTSLVTAVRQASWAHDGTICVDGWAYIDNVDLSEEPATTRIWLRDLRTDERHPVQVSRRPDPTVTRVSKHQWCNYESSGFRATIDAQALAEVYRGREGAVSRLRLEVEVDARGVVRTSPLLSMSKSGSAGQVPGRLLLEDLRILPRFVEGEGYELELRHVRALATEVSVEGRTFRARVRGLNGFRPVTVVVEQERLGLVHKGRLQPVGDDELEGSVEVPLPPAEVGQQSVPYLVRLEDTKKRRRPLSWAADDDQPETGALLSVVRTLPGNVGLVHRQGVVVEDAELSGRRLRLRLSCPADLRDGLQVELRSHRAFVTGVVSGEGDQLDVVLDLEADPWGFGSSPLPTGSYLLMLTAPDEVPDASSEVAGPRIVTQTLDQRLTSKLPLPIVDDQLAGQVERRSSGALAVTIRVPLREDEHGAFNGRRLRAHYFDRPAPAPEHAVLFRSYYGDSASCNPLAIHRELRRRGSDLQLLWSVKDHSVAVPEGAVPVVQQSQAWLSALRSSKYLVDNMHQPAFFEKGAEQVLVETFHGYPFKSMGHPHWNRMGMDAGRLASLDARAAQWDYLVSPATYASGHLQRDFRYGGQMLEIGYPRNDVLLSPGRDDIRDATRDRFGLAPGAKVVLYAPTFRDNLSQDDFRAPMVDYLDVPRLVDALGDDHVVLVRGHAFNARMAGRLERQGSVIDVTDYPDVADLYLAADMLVADYSSLRFDFALTDKPMVFLVPDLEDYRDQARGWLFDFSSSAPGPKVSTTDEVIEALLDLPALETQYKDEYQQFHRDFHDLEDGRAAERFVDEVFGSRGDA